MGDDSDQIALPLAGIRVIDFGQFIAGPAAAMMLADQGAEVIRVDRPDGPMWDSPANAILNRGKKSIVLDLKEEKDQSIARDLIASADIVVENFRPAVMKRFGLDGPTMTTLHSHLVYLSLPGFSASDPDYAHVQAWEGIISSAVGQFMDMGLNRVLMGINPSFSPLPLASAYAAVLGATGALLAYHKRQATGQGDLVEVPLASALLEALAYNSMVIDGLPERYKSLREREIERRQAAGEALDMSYEDLQEFLDPFYRTYVCSDGRPFYAVCSSHASHPIRALEVLGIWKEIKSAGIPLEDPYTDTDSWGLTDCTLLAYPLTPPWSYMVAAKMKDAFATKPAEEWEKLFGEAGVPGVAHRTTKEWIASDHALKSRLIVSVDDPAAGKMKQCGNTVWLKSTGVRIAEKQPAPEPNADREALLDEIGNSLGPVDYENTPDNEEGWLDGLKIVDLTNVIAGPTIASLLSRFGAEVISIDPPKPALDPWNTIVFGIHANRGKSSILVDLKAPQGKEILKRLLRDADVVTANVLDRQLSDLGLDQRSLKKINPELILCQLDAYGGPSRGPLTNHPGYDDLVQATTGVMARFGGSLDTPEEHAHFGTIDVLAGFCGALATAVALVKRQNGQGGDVARTSLAAAGQLIQLPFMFDYKERGPFNEPSGRDAMGEHALYRCYEASDGWFFLAAHKNRLRRFERVRELVGAFEVDEDNLEPWLAERFRSKTREYWVTAFRAIGVGAHAINSLANVRERNLVTESEMTDLMGPTMRFIHHTDHPSGYMVELVAPNAVRSKRAKIKIPPAAPKYGTHTRDILIELGYRHRDINAMIEEEVIAETWSENYLPR